MISIFTITFGRPDLLVHQKRLMDKFLGDEFGLCAIDVTPGLTRNIIQRVCGDIGIGYLHVPSQSTAHNDALNFAALHATQIGSEYFGFLDHDIFPRKPTTLIDKITPAGVFGLSQCHRYTGSRYLWPGFCFFSRDWVNGRVMNFGGIRGPIKDEDGDCGSMLYPLFSHDDWMKMPMIALGYRQIRPEDEHGMQSWGYELIGDWVHFSNASHWKQVPDPLERDRLLTTMLECL